MILERIKSEGIAHFSYLLGSGDDAAVIDPRRDCRVYIDSAQKHGLKIKRIFETHRNEDYVIGSLELQSMTGAEIWHGPGLKWKYGNTLKDGQSFTIGELKLFAMHTPGHTAESMSYVIVDTETGKEPVAAFTGDALFVGDVGRTDLYGTDKAAGLASHLYDSLFSRLLLLGDGVIIYPAHGGGSVCGMNIADREESTIGIERLQNPALQVKNKVEFVERKIAEKPEIPHYFRKMEVYNLEGPPLLGSALLPPPLTAEEFKQAMDRGAVVVDTSEPAAFGGIHIKGSYSIWTGGLPNFAGWVLSYDKPILLVLEGEAGLERPVNCLRRAGYDNIAGYLKGNIESWYNAGLPLESLRLLSVHQLKERLDKKEKLTALDVRGEEEWKRGHIPGAMHIYIGHLEERIAEVPRNKPAAVYCGSGHRAGLGASILLRAGYTDVYNVPGSITGWVAAGYPVVKDKNG